MSATAIKINSPLAEEARAASRETDRSLTGQVEHWAKLGKALEPHLTTAVVNSLKTSEGQLENIADPATKAEVLAILERFRTLPRTELRDELQLAAKTHYEPDPENPGGLIRIEPNGTRTHGSLNGREFIPS